MKFSDIKKAASGLPISTWATDPGMFLKQEIEQGIEPITQRVDRLEKKLDLLLLTMGRIESLLVSLQPLSDLVKKIPFFK